MAEEVAREHRGTFDLEGDDSVVTAVVISVAAVAGVEPNALPPLQETVDTDALERIVGSAATADTEMTVTFEYAGFQVAVDAAGTIRIGDPSAPN